MNCFLAGSTKISCCTFFPNKWDISDLNSFVNGFCVILSSADVDSGVSRLNIWERHAWPLLLFLSWRKDAILKCKYRHKNITISETSPVCSTWPWAAVRPRSLRHKSGWCHPPRWGQTLQGPLQTRDLRHSHRNLQRRSFMTNEWLL